MQDSAELRRQQRIDRPDLAEKNKQAALRHYRKENPLKPTKLANGLLTEGVVKEVHVEGMDHPVAVEVFSIPQAADAMGKSELTFKKWIADDLIPEPILRDTSKGYRHYSVGELKVMARVIAEHERDNAYYTTMHKDTKLKLMQHMHAYRAQYI